MRTQPSRSLLAHACGVLLPLVFGLSACADPGAEEDGESGDETEESGGEWDGRCLDVGSPLVDRAKEITPLSEATAELMGVVCSTGWASDAPMLEASWSLDLGLISSPYGSSSTQMALHPDGGVVVFGVGVLARVDAQGQALWSRPELTANGWIAMGVVEADGTLLVPSYEEQGLNQRVLRLDAEGNEIDEFVVPLNDPSAEISAMVRWGSDVVMGLYDLSASDQWFEATFLRVSSDGEELLRKSNEQLFQANLLAVTDAGNAFFSGSLLAAENGAVLGTIVPSAGGVRAIVGGGPGDDAFYVAGSSGDLTVSSFSSFGVERWLQRYDRAGGSDVGLGIASTGDGGAVVVGSERLLGSLSEGGWWFFGQPTVIAVGSEGEALWRDRIAALGEAHAAVVDESGAVYVAGVAESTEIDDEDYPERLYWLRRYDP
ncbi:hypothetical protein G6O69_29305 [Pseudenhygromyxa sp. WMMC2535]|uniref:hypothetical protein n=1 Tax=Pseudenhygromyxa sp. WMMC2535 TaxID=2712867 RepID=UPI001552C95D|nr:hypothetical protein [Pseudenhygromyxa sp. WMMC2535]NVB41961.1 hypothetical protein [Pseudenhygromyxa sp. WMMC2535]